MLMNACCTLKPEIDVDIETRSRKNCYGWFTEVGVDVFLLGECGGVVNPLHNIPGLNLLTDSVFLKGNCSELGKYFLVVVSRSPRVFQECT